MKQTLARTAADLIDTEELAPFLDSEAGHPVRHLTADEDGNEYFAPLYQFSDGSTLIVCKDGVITSGAWRSVK